MNTMKTRPDPGLVAQVQALLDGRDARQRPANQARPTAQVTAEGGATEMLIYDEISWWGISASDVAAALAGVTGDLHVRVNSPGGDVFDGIAIYNMLIDHPGKVTVTVDGLAASAASFIAQAGDEIRMNRGSQMMIHDASGMCWGNSADMTAMASLLDMVSGTLAGIYAARTGTDADTWRAAMREETWYTAEAAVEAGLADAMVPHPGQEADATPQDAVRSLVASLYPYGLPDGQRSSRPAASAPVATPPTDPAPEPSADPAPVDEVQDPPAPAPLPDPDPPPAEPEPPAGQADDTTESGADAPADDWADMAAHLTEPPSEADEWESMREALL